MNLPFAALLKSWSVPGLLLLFFMATIASFAHAQSLPSSALADCSKSGSTYTCSGNLEYSNDTTFTLTGNVVINVSGNFTAQKNFTVTTNGYTLTLTVSGNVDLKKDTNLGATVNITTSGNFAVAEKATINGSITASGNIDIAKDSTINGNLTASGNITLSSGTVVNGTCNKTPTGSGSCTGGTKTLSIADASTTEGNGGTKTLSFTVTLSPAATSNITVDYATSDGTATTADSDYVSKSGTLTFTSGESSKNIDITLNGDTKYEPDEDFTVVLSNASGASLADPTATGTIVNDDSPLKIAKMSSTASALLNDVITYTITASNPSGSPLANVVLTDVLPASMSYSASSVTLGSVAVAGQTVTWTIPSLPPSGGSAQMLLAVQLTQTGVLTNTVTSPGVTSASADVLVLSSAVTHFRFDETVGSWSGAAGEVLDSGGTALHGRRLTTSTPTTTNVVLPSPIIGPPSQPNVVGQFCNAGQFDGNAAVEVGASSLFDYTTKLSATAWIYPTAAPTGSNLYSILSNDQNYEFHLNSSSKLYWWWGGGTKSMTSTGNIPLNQWTHIAITSDSSPTGGRQRIYINGVLDASVNTWKGTRTPNGCNFYIGGDVGTSSGCPLIPARNFRGMIDEAKLYNYELSAAEVLADMNLGRSCSGTFDHIRIEHDGTGSVCNAETVTIKACLNSSCSSLYSGSVTVRLSPAGWADGDTFTLNGGLARRELRIGGAGNVTLGTISVTPVPASATRCFNGGTETCVMNFATASCTFDMVEAGANPQTRLLTKLAGTDFNLDLLALSNSTTINSTYTGTATVDLVDASASDCPATYPGLTSEASVQFTSEGRKALTFNYPNAARVVRVRARVGTGTPACSYDNFSIRPLAFAVSSTNANNTGTFGTPIFKAGSDSFNLTATALAGYDGTPLIDSNLLIGTPTAGSISGNFGPADTASGVAAGNTFTYSEVGNVGMQANAVYDDSFTAIDQSNDCTNDFSTSLVGGKYGCKIGSQAVAQTTGSSGLGRFIPDHFVLTAGSITPGSGSMSYMDQPFGIGFTLTAVNAGGGTTSNYAGSFAKLDPTSTTLWPSSTLGSTGFGSGAKNAGTDLSTRLSLSGTPTGSWTSGVAAITANLKFSRPGTATADATWGPYDDLDIGVAPQDSDGVKLATVALDLDADSSGSSERKKLNTTTTMKQRFGRLRLLNFYGSELLKPRVEYRTEYWDGTRWAINTLDSTSSPIVAANLATAGLTVNGITGLTSGVGFITFNTAGVGSYDIAVNLNSSGAVTSCNAVNPTGTTAANKEWLQGFWSGSCNSIAAWQQDPNARIKLGSPKAPYINLRESY